MSLFTQPRRSPPSADAAAAAARVRSGDHVVVSGCGAAPLGFLRHLADRTDLEDVTISHATAWGALPHLAEAQRPHHLHFDAYFLPAKARRLHSAGQVDYIPLTFSQMQSMYRSGTLRADVVVAACSEPDESGFCSLGPFVSYLPQAMATAREVIGECSSTWPLTGGAARVHACDFSLLIPGAFEPLGVPDVQEQRESRAIAAHVASLVPDGATIQIGRGAIPNAVAAALTRRRDLGVHSEMLSDWIVDLHASGALTGSRKLSHPGKIVTSFMDGSARLYEWAHRNESLVMLPIYEVNDPMAVGMEPNFFAINSAVEVDLTGQINAECTGGHLLSGSGGLLDFAIGAARSPNGRFIVALPSTAKGGTVSRIVRRIGEGGAVTVPRTLADAIVTEHGIADLRGCNLAERARRLLAVADPAFRAALSRGEAHAKHEEILHA